MPTEQPAGAESGHELTKTFSLSPGQGTPTWPLDALDVIKVTSEQTGGRFGLIETHQLKDSGPPRHVHEREDEGYYVLEGEYTFFVGDETISAPAGTWVFCPRGIAHTFRCETPLARTLVFITPGGFENFFLETFGRAPEYRMPPPLEATSDLEYVAAQAANYGVTILGPSPGRNA